MDTLTLAIIGHLAGDYLLQTDWMAQNKKLHSWPCFVHCMIWTACVAAFAGLGPLALAFIFACHFAQDRTHVVRWWMALPWKNQTGFMKAPLSPWSMIVVDNVWHILQLYVAVRFLS